MRDHSLAIAICRACTGGSQDAESVAIRIAGVLGTARTKSIVSMAERYALAFNGTPSPREQDVLQFVSSDSSWIRRIRTQRRGAKPKTVRAWPLYAPQMHAVPAAQVWQLPAIETSGALADWLGTEIDELDWLADNRQLLRDAHRSRLHHYHYRLIRKKTGGIRLVEAPQARLKTIQRKILADILEKIPPYDSAAHGFVKGRSVHTFAAPHVGQRVVIRIDLRDFFPTIGYARIQALFRTMGYPEPVANALSGLCTNVAPRALFSQSVSKFADREEMNDARQLYVRPHLPQGAPTSPMLANLCAFHLDCRLTGLADWAGATYTRYADDIAISGGDAFARDAARYAAQASAIAIEEGWHVQHHKTRIMRAGVRQHLAGIVVNECPNITRTSFDELKAILTNCIRHGPANQNRDGLKDFRAHLRGRIAWVTSVNPAKGKRLQDTFDRILWD